MKIALLQINLTVGDLEGNLARIQEECLAAFNEGADLCVTSELALLGYPPRDLLFNKGFIDRAWDRLEELAGVTRQSGALLVGIAEPNPASWGRPLYNTAALLRQGRVEAKFRKCLLPNYDVFDEERYFQPVREPGLFELAGRRIGVTVCEDVWNDKDFWSSRRYEFDPVERLMANGAEAIVNLSASPFVTGKHRIREAMLVNLARRHKVPILYCNQVGGNDDLVFPGRSCAYDSQGRLMARARPFAEDRLIVDPDRGGAVARDGFVEEEEIWQALVLGTRDYVHKSGFAKVLLGLSGGIDSSLTAAVAAEAVGPDNVLGVLMPSRFTSQASGEDALALAANLHLTTLTLPIEDIFQTFLQTLHASFAQKAWDVTEENLQARIRGNLLMALSNKHGAMLLTTGNKSELAVGYCTIYGDMSGGLAVISDVPKTMVYRLSRWLNAARGGIIPERVLTKAPTAELRPNQTDQDSLPPYSVLDAILDRYLVGQETTTALTADGYDPAIVDRVVRMVHAAEFKRRQSPPGIKVTDRAFGTGWRMPIAKRLRF